MMDLSDGLGADLPRLARASGLGFEIEETAIPRNRGCTIKQAINDGEDYELLFAIASREQQKLQASWKKEIPQTSRSRASGVSFRNPRRPPAAIRISVAMFISNSAEETAAIGRERAHAAQKGDVIALAGDLGAGKTQFVKGFVAGLDSEAAVTSPTFTLLHEYTGGRMPVYHFDFYRLEDHAAALRLGLDDYFFGDGVCVIEWADRFRDLIPPQAQWISFKMKSETARDDQRMKIFALENSTTRGSIALLDDRDAPIVFDYENDRKHSGAFFQSLERLSDRLHDADAIVVGLGPGSYAGVRIAIAAAIGLQAGADAQLLGAAFYLRDRFIDG